VKTVRIVVLKRLSATAERYIIYFNFCILVRTCENQGSPYQDDNCLSSSRNDRKNWVTVKIEISIYLCVSCNLEKMHKEVVFSRGKHLHSKLSVDIHGTAMSLGLNTLASD
jgi:hypothetical protein